MLFIKQKNTERKMHGVQGASAETTIQIGLKVINKKCGTPKNFLLNIWNPFSRTFIMYTMY